MIRESVQSNWSLKNIKPVWAVLLVTAGLLAALLIRWSMRSFITMDYTTSLKRWYDAIVSYRGMPALAYPFSNYTPPYLYILILTTRLNFLHPLAAIKLVSVIFDFITAFVVFKIMRLHFVNGWVPFGAALLLLLTPTIFINSA